MHLVESFALNTGLKIGKPYIYEKYISLPFQEEYITFQPFGKFDSRKYDYWDEVLDLLGPILARNKIKIIQLGMPDESDIFGCVNYKGRTDYNQVAYLIRNSILHLGVDSFGIHFASGLGKKIVGLYCNMLPSQSGPYWSKKRDVIILEPQRKDKEKPSYAAFESPKTINKIKPEDIAKAVCRQLNLQFDYPYETIYVGSEYQNRKIELLPVTWLSNYKELGVDSLIVRMDHFFSEETLTQQLLRCKCSIITNKPINLNLLVTHKEKINELIFFVDETTDAKYFQLLKINGIKFFLMSKSDKESLEKIKLDYLDIANIIHKETPKKDNILEIKDKDLKNLYYKSSCLTVVKSKIYSSKAFQEDNLPITKVRGMSPAPVVDNQDFWDGLDNYLILEKKS